MKQESSDTGFRVRLTTRKFRLRVEAFGRSAVYVGIPTIAAVAAAIIWALAS